MPIYQFAKVPFNIDMMTINEIRLANLALLKKEFGTDVILAELGNTSAAYLSQIRSKKTPRSMGDEVARNLEIGCNKPVGWMDQYHDETEEDDKKHILGDAQRGKYVVSSPKDPTKLQPNIDEITNLQTEPRPPVIDEEQWKKLPPKTKALIEDLLIKTTSGKLKESGTKLLQNTLDELSKDP